MGVVLSLTTDGPDATRALGTVMGADLQAGDVLALSGELGAGKTCLVQGLAAGLGVSERVTSPTFVLVRTLTGGRVPLVHVDVYRLDQLSDVEGLGDDVLAPDVVTVIEWGDTVDALLPEQRLLVEIEHGDHADQRLVSIHGADRQRPRVAQWQVALGECAGVSVDPMGA